MGGSVCKILVRSQLTFTAVPTEVEMLRLFDAQMKAIHFKTYYAQSIRNETDDSQEICEILGKQPPHWTPTQWTHADRQKLLDVVNEICGPYP